MRFSTFHAVQLYRKYAVSRNSRAFSRWYNETPSSESLFGEKIRDGLLLNGEKEKKMITLPSFFSLCLMNETNQKIPREIARLVTW